MPRSGDKALPGSKAWKAWYDVRLRTWAAAMDADFQVELDKYVYDRGGNVGRFGRENRRLAYELASMVDDKMLLYLMPVDKTDGAAMLK
eukprot:6215376-Alexandrium_andersonii.AAC.1